MSPILDPEVRHLAKIATVIRKEYLREDNSWTNSPFAWIRTRPSGQVGKIGEQLIAGWCAGKGLEVVKCRDAEADPVIAGHRMEVKFSTLWKSGLYVFQQLRNQNYEYVICLGIAPFEAHCWVIPKDSALEHATPQHTGKEGEETFWLHIPADNPPDWLSPYGGTLTQALDRLKGICFPGEQRVKE